MKIKLPRPRKPKYWEIVITWTVLTVVGLFGLQYVHESWSMANAFMSEMPETGQAMAEMQVAQHQKMASGALSIEEAMQRVVSADRNTIPLIAPEASTDMGPAAGWMHHPDYEAPPAFDPATMIAPLPEEPEPTDGDLEGEDDGPETPTLEEAPVVPAPRPPADAPPAMVRLVPPAMAAPTAAMAAPAAPMAPAMMNAPAAAPAPAPAAEE